MKKLFLLLLLGSPCLAAGPKHQFEDAMLNDEFVNVYFDQANTFKRVIPSATITSLAVSTITLVSSETVKNLTVTGTLTYAGTLGKVLQIVSAQTTTAKATTSSTFQDTALTASITPSSTASKVLILVTAADIFTSANNVTCFATIARGGTNLASAAGLAKVRGSTVGQIFAGVAPSWLDAPASVASLTYTFQIRNSDNATDVEFLGGGGTGNIILVEIL